MDLKKEKKGNKVWFPSGGVSPLVGFPSWWVSPLQAEPLAPAGPMAEPKWGYPEPIQ